MSMLKLKWMGTACLMLTAVACDFSPVNSENADSRRPYPPQQPYPRDQSVPEYAGERRPFDPDSGYDSPYGEVPPPPARPPQHNDYPTAERTNNPNRVISPYGPDFNVIDVQGFRSGQLAKDPSNGKIFRVP